MARTGNLLHNPDIGTYIGFGEYLSMTGCVFEPLGTNRVVSPDVIARRVAANLSEQASSGRYCQFGSISLCAVRGDDSVDDSGHVEHAGVEGGAPRSAGGTTAKFFVLDGQHRLGVMRELRQINPATPIHFELRCTVVQSGEEATACLHAMQDAYPPDARLFFDGRVENVLASHLLDFARHRWPLLFREELPREWSERRGTLRMDPPRPFLNAGVFFDLVRDFGVLDTALKVYNEEGGRHAGDVCVSAQAGLLELVGISDAISRRRAAGDVSFGAVDTWRRCRDPKRGYLGMYKRDAHGQQLLRSLTETAPVS